MRGLRGMIVSLLLTLCASGVWSQDNEAMARFQEIYTYVSRLYVDSVKANDVIDKAIVKMLEELDPHSSYISPEDVSEANERIMGSFVGIGIRFRILHDTLTVVSPTPGGPSERVGIRSGDKIVEVDGNSIARINLDNQKVKEHLLGEKGTKVKLTVIRRGERKKLDFEVTRDKIALSSVAAAYMVTPEIGYIKVTTFSRTTPSEFRNAIDSLNRQGMQNLVLDLQGNPGGLKYAAERMADEFLDDGKLIVFSEGRAQPRKESTATKMGSFERGRLVILTDEGTASASEIVSGAVQDWDRGLIVGRRSFGKGLVQKPIELRNGGQLRLTIARYFTPSGRFIQKSYDHGVEAYRQERSERGDHGELFHADSIKVADSLMFETKVNKRKVYGGGGIVPDFFVALDTSEYSDYFRALSHKSIIGDFCLDYCNANRTALHERYSSFEDFNEKFSITRKLKDEFKNYAKHAGVEYSNEGYNAAEELIKVRIKAGMAQNLYSFERYIEVMNQSNASLQRAVELINDGTYDASGLSVHD